MSSRFVKKICITIWLCILIVLLASQQPVSSSVVQAQIISLSSPVKVCRGSVIRVTVYIKNTGSESAKFYVGASIIGAGESTWKDLPGWGYTTTINPGSTGSFTFGDYTIPNDAYIGYHGIMVKVWTDSTKSTVVAERWFENVIEVISVNVEIVGLDIIVVKP